MNKNNFMIKNLILIILFIGFYCTCFSQKPNGDFDIGGNYMKNNNNSYNLNVNFNYKQDSTKIYWDINPTYTLNYTNKLINRDFHSIESFGIKLNNCNLMFFNENENSYSRKIDYKGSFGIGVGCKIIKNKSCQFDISEAFMPTMFDMYNTDNNLKISYILSTRIRFYLIFNKFQLS